MVTEAVKVQARALRAAGVSLREIGKTFGVSHVTAGKWTRDVVRARVEGPPGASGVETGPVESGPLDAVDLSTTDAVLGELDRLYVDISSGRLSVSTGPKLRVLLAKLEVLRRRETACVGHVDGAEALAQMQSLMDTVRTHLMRHWESEGQPAEMEASFSRLAEDLNRRLKEYAERTQDA